MCLRLSTQQEQENSIGVNRIVLPNVKQTQPALTATVHITATFVRSTVVFSFLGHDAGEDRADRRTRT